MNFKQLLKNSGMTQKELAQKLGKTQQLISKWIKGGSSPQPPDTLKLSEILNVSTEEILKCFE